jgi:nucleoside-diphosphate-sugar epimerase
MKKAVLLGGAGFIGLNIARHLLEKANYEVTIVDNFFRGKKDEALKEVKNNQNVTIVSSDLTNPTEFEQLDDEYDHVYMLASVVGVKYTEEMPDEIIRINTQLILNTLEWLKGVSCQKALFTSTSEAYAGSIEAFDYAIPTPEEVPLCIEDIQHPRFTYAVTKMLGESGFINYARRHDFECTIVRYHNIYGPRMGFKHVIPEVAQRFYEGEEPFKIYGYNQTRAFCYIDDAVEATVLAMESEKANNEIFHIGNMDDELKIETLIKFMGELNDYEGDYKLVSAPSGSVSRRCPDISKAKKLLGYVPKTDWKTGVKKTNDWYINYLESGKNVFE